VPFESIQKVVFETREAWEEFKRRVSRYYKKSPYLSKVADMVWSGALLYGDGRKLIKILIQGIPGVRYEEARCPESGDGRKRASDWVKRFASDSHVERCADMEAILEATT
jgi:hypothetical protein